MTELALVGDIGGTNARLALVEEGSTNLQAVHTLLCRDFGNIDESIEAYLNMVGAGPVARACIAIASLAGRRSAHDQQPLGVFNPGGEGAPGPCTTDIAKRFHRHGPWHAGSTAC